MAINPPDPSKYPDLLEHLENVHSWDPSEPPLGGNVDEMDEGGLGCTVTAMPTTDEWETFCRMHVEEHEEYADLHIHDW